MKTDIGSEKELRGLIYFLQLVEASREPVCMDGPMWLEMVRRHGLVFLELRRPGKVVPEELMRYICQAVRQYFRPQYVLRSGVAARHVANEYTAYVCWPDGPVGVEWKRPLAREIELMKEPA